MTQLSSVCGRSRTVSFMAIFVTIQPDTCRYGIIQSDIDFNLYLREVEIICPNMMMSSIISCYLVICRCLALSGQCSNVPDTGSNPMSFDLTCHVNYKCTCTLTGRGSTDRPFSVRVYVHVYISLLLCDRRRLIALNEGESKSLLYSVYCTYTCTMHSS